MGTGTLVVHRPRGGWRDFARSYRIEVDGERRGRLRRGQDLSVDLPTGTHVVRARIDWNGSPEVTVVIVTGSVTRCRVAPAGSAASAAAQVVGRRTWLELTVESGPTSEAW